ncbi:HAD-like domain-containing protein [Xylaria bambusicola]|uniref:HAD-like domain-containing protein n=1 Tax=Xylaria bambusicola TaxID=326684 RepID=UPI00200881D0|nr:HAD-like domain-containing protein [Xylaria bambusicola]KAI0517655.1 HAD-like domain-containing protein [Xylaria bambusicola]
MPPVFPPVRACLFDMDGLLINTEDMYTKCANIVLEKYGRPPLPWSIKAQMMGIPGSSNGDTFHNWAQLPISRGQFKQEQSEQQRLHFPQCEPLPGVEKLMADLQTAKNADGYPVQIALATSSMRETYELKMKMPATKALIERIPPEHRVIGGGDERVKRGKPAPDVFLLALRCINETLPEGVPEITLRECLVFEDSVIGVEAGRRAGMRTLWIPHPGLLEEYIGREADVLAGRIGMVSVGDEEQLGQPGDGWGEQLRSLEDFPYERYGIVPQGI